jgi:hypothetical protein
MKRSLVALLLLAASACSHLATVAPNDADLSGTWVLDARRSDSPPPMGHRRSEVDEGEGRPSAGGGQSPARYGGPTPLLTMVTATQMTIDQDSQSMGIAYPNEPYRDIKWGEQKRGLFTIEAGWEAQQLIILTKSQPMTVREAYSLSDAGNTLTIVIDLSSKRMGDRHLTRVFTRKPAATESAR